MDIELFKKKEKIRHTYKYTVFFTNGQKTEGVIETENIRNVYKLLMFNNFTTIGKKSFYYNADKIQTVEVEEILDEILREKAHDYLKKGE